MKFIEQHTDSGGGLGRLDPFTPDYPNYATALAVLALSGSGRETDRSWAGRMVAYLRAQQFSEDNGWSPKHPAYGGWGMGGEPRTPPHAGHVDLSMTRYVLQALAVAGVPETDPALERARVFLGRCQNYDRAGTGDGGFFFSSVVLDTNKAGAGPRGYRSYGTATADGILALLAAGCSQRDASVRKASHWLLQRQSADEVPGFDRDPYRRWAAGLWYYYAAACSEVFARLGEVHSARFTNELLAKRRPDGSWTNPETLVKEDDPLIATALAIRALANEGAVRF